MDTARTERTYDPKAGALPVLGYKPQTQTAVDCVNAMKAREELILRQLDFMAADPDVDQYWLALGRADLERAFMAINRSIFRPARVAFPSEERPGANVHGIGPDTDPEPGFAEKSAT